MNAHLDRYISGDSPTRCGRHSRAMEYKGTAIRSSPVPLLFPVAVPRLPDAIEQVDDLYIPETLHPPDILISFQPLKIPRHQLHPPTSIFIVPSPLPRYHGHYRALIFLTNSQSRLAPAADARHTLAHHRRPIAGFRDAIFFSASSLFIATS